MNLLASSSGHRRTFFARFVNTRWLWTWSCASLSHVQRVPFVLRDTFSHTSYYFKVGTFIFITHTSSGQIVWTVTDTSHNASSIQQHVVTHRNDVKQSKYTHMYFWCVHFHFCFIFLFIDYGEFIRKSLYLRLASPPIKFRAIERDALDSYYIISYDVV